MRWQMVSAKVLDFASNPHIQRNDTITNEVSVDLKFNRHPTEQGEFLLKITAWICGVCENIPVLAIQTEHLIWIQMEGTAGDLKQTLYELLLAAHKSCVTLYREKLTPLLDYADVVPGWEIDDSAIDDLIKLLQGHPVEEKVNAGLN
jgi:hypothetical protein